MLETDYKHALHAATDAETRYLAAVRGGEARGQLTSLAEAGRDLWAAVATVCALGEDEARSRIETLPLRHRSQALHSAWLTRRNWAACGEDASARCELMGALVGAHLDVSATPRRGLRLVADR